MTLAREKGQLEERNDDDYNDIKSKSKTTQAIKMFSEGQEPTQVVIELDLSPEEVRMIYRQYLETKNSSAINTGYLPISLDNPLKESKTLKTDNRELYNVFKA